MDGIMFIKQISLFSIIYHEKEVKMSNFTSPITPRSDDYTETANRRKFFWIIIEIRDKMLQTFDGLHSQY